MSKELHEQINKLLELALSKIKQEQSIDPYREQKIYEKWIKADEWSLREHALPLTVGVDPDDSKMLNEESYRAQEVATWTALSDAFSNSAAAALINAAEPAESWRVKPSDYYQWLNKQAITVPDALDSLMQFILSVVSKPAQSHETMSIDDYANIVPQSRSSDREKVLGAALNIVAKEPDECRDPSGLMNGHALAEMINGQSVLWFDSPSPPMSVEAMGELLEKWLE